MRSCLVLLLLVALVLPAAGQKHMPNIGYVASGYNIFMGSPLSTGVGVDPGFINGRQVYNISHSSGQTTGDERYFVPDGMQALSNVGCVLSFDANTDISIFAQDYTNTLKKKADAGTPLPFSFSASFKASDDHHRMADLTSNASLRMVSSAAECTQYTVKIDYATPPPFFADFLEAVKGLPIDYIASDYMNLFDAFGTHVITEATIGSRYGYHAFFDEVGANSVTETGYTLAAAAGLHGVVKAGGSLSDASKKKAEEAFAANQQHVLEITLGAPPEDGDEIKWAQQVVEEPMPISYKLTPICGLLADSQKQANCWAAARDSEYCTKRLQANQKVALCLGDPPLKFLSVGYPFAISMMLATPINNGSHWKGTALDGFGNRWDLSIQDNAWMLTDGKYDYLAKLTDPNARTDPTVDGLVWVNKSSGKVITHVKIGKPSNDPHECLWLADCDCPTCIECVVPICIDRSVTV